MPIPGAAVLLAVTFRTSPDGPVVDPDNVSLTISLGSTVILGPITPPDIDRISVGRYEYEWAIPLTATVGTYTAQWSGILPGDTALTYGYETISVTATENTDAADDSFVTVADLKAYMSGIGLDADQAGASQDVLDGLQRELERHCQRRFKTQAYVETIYPDEFGRLWPKNTPVLDVLEPVGYSGLGNQIVGTDGLFAPYAVFSSSGPVTVKYVAGLDPADAADVRAAILRADAREVTDRHDDTLSVRDTDARREQRTDNRVVGFTDDELRRFDRLRRRTVA